MKRKILIGGCSFSQYQNPINNPAWISWTNFLMDDLEPEFRIINRAQSSFGQNRIFDSMLEELIRYSFEIDYVLVQWSAVTRDISHTISDPYKSSLNRIFTLKTLLKSKNIPYKMFWGWQQITSDIEEHNKKILGLIYDEDFWTINNHGGMSEYIIEKVGREVGLVSKDDFHPSTTGQEYFYKNIVKSWSF